MPKKSDLLPGTIFQQLTIINKANKKGPTGRSYYNCACSCGNNTLISRSELQAGKTKSCGCLRRSLPTANFKLEAGEASYRCLYQRCKRGAKIRGIPFDLSTDRHRALIKDKCNHCGKPPIPFNCYNYKVQANMTTESAKDAWVLVNGIDRLDPNLGYTEANCVPCCTPCNYGKLDYTQQEYIAHCRKVVAFQDSK